jgi:hypothetical protein
MLRVRLNPHRVTAIYPYIDTLELFFPAVFAASEAYKREVRTAVRNCYHKGRWSGQRVMIQLPNPDTIRWLDYVAEKYDGTVRRVDVALDMAARDCEALREIIETQAILRWQRCHLGMEEIGETLYWDFSEWPLRRNLILYADRHNKLTGEFPCTHLELRLFTARVVKNSGILRPRDLLTLNPAKLFHRHVGWSNMGARYVKERMRAEALKDRLEHKGKELSPFMDQYRASLPKRVEHMLRVGGWDRAQKLKYVGVMERPVEKLMAVPFPIPHRLSWV